MGKSSPDVWVGLWEKFSWTWTIVWRWLIEANKITAFEILRNFRWSCVVTPHGHGKCRKWKCSFSSYHETLCLAWIYLIACFTGSLHATSSTRSGLASISPCYRLVWKYSRKPLCCPPRLVEECGCEWTWKAARSRVQTSLLNLPSLLLLLIHCHVTSHSELQITSSANSPPWRAIELLRIILLKFQWKQKLGITQGM